MSDYKTSQIYQAMAADLANKGMIHLDTIEDCINPDRIGDNSIKFNPSRAYESARHAILYFKEAARLYKQAAASFPPHKASIMAHAATCKIGMKNAQKVAEHMIAILEIVD